MSKALTGAAELAGAVGMGALAFFDPAVLAIPGYANFMVGLGMAGVSTEFGAIADAITQNRGQNITTRQPAAFRQVVYGTQRVGGILIYPSTTGSHKDQYNRVIVLATHELSAITALYLDGRQVYWVPGRVGYSTYNGSDFGGDSDGNTHTGPNGVAYNFGDSNVYCEPRFGNQVDGDVIGGLTANDPTWAAGPNGSPWVGGCAYVYLKIEYNETNFPGDPEIRFTVQGKPVYDPRTGLTAYSANPALILNDILIDPQYGMNDFTVNQAQLIAAANICDEQVWSAGANAYESRYQCHWHYDTSTGIGDIVDTVLATMGGRLCRIGGQWQIFPAAYIAPSASFTADNLTAPVQWSSKRAQRELFNEVRGTYTAPNFPYNIAGNYYDTNGFANGQIQNNFGFAFQPTNYPAYAEDTDHGYASNQYLNQDTSTKGLWNAQYLPGYAAGDTVIYNGLFYKALVNGPGQLAPNLNSAQWVQTQGTLLTKELGLPGVLSISQAQRLAKIALRRNRQQGTGRLQLNLKAFGLQDCDTFNMTFAGEGWTDKILEVAKTEWRLENGSPGQPPQIKYTVEVQETDPSVYEDFGSGEEQTIYAQPALAQNNYTVAPPTNMELVSGAGTALLQPDGTATPRIEVTWDTPEDIRVTQIRMRYRVSGTTVWNDGGLVDVALNVGYISPVVCGQTYDVGIQSVRSNGGTSLWEEIDAFQTSLVLSVQKQEGIGIGSLQAIANTNGSASIICNPFSTLIGSVPLNYFPSGPVTITTDGTLNSSGAAVGGNLVQQQNYYVYVVDPNSTGGNLSPIATTNRADFQGKLGYWLIDNVVTPYAATGSTSRVYPNYGSDSGSATTQNPSQAFDGDLSTAATISGSANAVYTPGYGGEPSEPDETDFNCDFTVSGFPAITSTTDLKLYIVISTSVRTFGGGTAGTVVVNGTVAGTFTTMQTFSSTTAQQTLTLDIPAGTDLSSVIAEVVATPGGVTAGPSQHSSNSTVSASLVEVYIQN